MKKILHPILKPEKIQESFNASTARIRNEWEKSGVALALDSLSHAVANLRAAGIDVAIDMSPIPGEKAFAMNAHGCVMPVSGILRLGHLQRLIAIQTRSHDANRLDILLSQFDTGVADNLAKTRALVYPLLTDKNAIVKFQTKIADDWARQQLMQEYDTQASLFPHILRKAVLKSPSKG